MGTSKYIVLLEALHGLKCPECRGLGECNDAEPGDMYCKEWTCTRCGGDGITPELEKITAFMVQLIGAGASIEAKGRKAQAKKERS
jgi:DnaJ-class molecular chaperone